jgi:hypothetical protein
MVAREDGALVIGAQRLDADGEPIRLPGFGTLRVIDDEGGAATVRVAAAKTGAAKAISTSAWERADLAALIGGSANRYASIDGPGTLAACGAPSGYGWYRVSLPAPRGADAKRTTKPATTAGAGDRAHFFADGRACGVVGVGPGADGGSFDLPTPATESTLVALVDNLGRGAAGNDLLDRKGLWDHLFEVEPLRGIRPAVVEADPVDPFVLRPFIAGLREGALGPMQHITWKFEHRRKTSLLLDVVDAELSGTFLLNDVPLAYFAGATGNTRMRRRLTSDETVRLKRGPNVLRFAPDEDVDAATLRAFGKAVSLGECTANLTESANWSFCKWEPPASDAFKSTTRAEGRRAAGLPCWWRGTFDMTRHPGDVAWLDLPGLTKGQVFVNGCNAGRYFVGVPGSTWRGAVERVAIPGNWLGTEGGDEIMVFDEHGAVPHAVTVTPG